MRDDVVPKRLDCLPGKRLVEAFDFLQADDIGRAFFEPTQQMLEPLPHRIDVPRGNSHEKGPARNQTFSVIWHTMAGSGVITVQKKARSSPLLGRRTAVLIV